MYSCCFLNPYFMQQCSTKKKKKRGEDSGVYLLHSATLLTRSAVLTQYVNTHTALHVFKLLSVLHTALAESDMLCS